MESQKSNSAEMRKDTAINNVYKLGMKINNIIESKNEFSPKPHQYVQYNNILSELSLYISEYSSDVDSLMNRLKQLPMQPVQALILNNSYSTLKKMTDELRVDIDGNSNFKADKSDSVAIAGEYLDYIRNTALNVNNTAASAESIRKVNNALLGEKADLENSRNELLKELDALRNENKVKQNLIDSNDEKVRQIILEKDKVNSDLNVANKELSYFKEVAQKTEVARNSTNFHNQADANKKAAKNWGICILATVVVFIAAIFILFSNSGELFDLASDIVHRSKGIESGLLKQLIIIEIIKKVATRLVIFSLVIYCISFLVKNYNAQMHNYIVNSHKANALRSTVDLIGTAKQDDGNDKIILQATQAIFTNQKSGYQGVENEPSSPNLITNVIDAVSGKKG